MEHPIAVISGGLGTIGGAIAKTLAAEGYMVHILTKRDVPGRSDSFLADFAGPAHQIIVCDISNEAAVQSAISSLPHIDILVHAAADPIAHSSIADLTLGTFKGQFDTTVFGAFILAKTTLPLLVKTKGLFLGITTSYAEAGVETKKMSGYISAKYALRGFLRELAQEYRGTGVRVNALAPDLMQTAFSAHLPPRFFEFAAERDPRGRLTTPEEVGQAALFFLADGKDLTGKSLLLPERSVSPL